MVRLSLRAAQAGFQIENEMWPVHVQFQVTSLQSVRIRATDRPRLLKNILLAEGLCDYGGLKMCVQQG
jgi:hypothetical protein